jgi:hypothetical protein
MILYYPSTLQLLGKHAHFVGNHHLLQWRHPAMNVELDTFSFWTGVRMLHALMVARAAARPPGPQGQILQASDNHG